jgi:hypothetical protein
MKHLADVILAAAVMAAVAISLALGRFFWEAWLVSAAAVLSNLPAFWFARNSTGTFWYHSSTRLLRTAVLALAISVVSSSLVLLRADHGPTNTLRVLSFASSVLLTCFILWQAGDHDDPVAHSSTHLVLDERRLGFTVFAVGCFSTAAIFTLLIAAATTSLGFTAFGVASVACTIGVLVPNGYRVVVTKNEISWSTFFPRGTKTALLSDVRELEYDAGAENDETFLVLRIGIRHRLYLYPSSQRKLIAYLSTNTPVQVRSSKQN